MPDEIDPRSELEEPACDDVDLASGSAEVPPEDPGVFEERVIAVNEAIPLSALWINDAIRMLGLCRNVVTGSGASTPLSRLALDALHRHFHTHRPNGRITEGDAIQLIERNFIAMRQFLSASSSIFAYVDDATAASNTRGYYGSEFTVAAYAYSRKGIAITGDFSGLGLRCRAAVLIHQLAHYIDSRIRDITGPRGPAYDALDTDTALWNVHCYPNFAVNASPPYRDERFGMTRPEV